MAIAIVIVNYKTPELVCACLDSLSDELNREVAFEVFVGDAESRDGSTEIISKHIAQREYDWASCDDNGANNGFAAGNNIILRRSVLHTERFKYVYFLNPDTYIRPRAVASLYEFLESHPEAAAVGSRLENSDGSRRAYAFRFPTPWREFFRGVRIPGFDRLQVRLENLDERFEVDWVSGAAFMVRRSVIDQVGLMDEGYFLYFEEVEFLFRIRKAGYEVWHEPASRVVHLAGQATGVREDTVTQKPISEYWLNSRWKFFCDKYGLFQAAIANCLFLLGDLFYRIHRILRGKPLNTPPGSWQSYWSNGFSMPPKRFKS